MVFMDRLDSQLHAAARAGDAALVRAWLAAGADSRVRDSTGCTPLHHAAHGGRTSCVAALLGAGADPLASSYTRATPLHLAADYGAAAGAVRLLIQAAPAAALVRDTAKRTPVERALLRIHTHGTVLGTAHALLADAPLPPVGKVLAALFRAGSAGRPLYAVLAARQSLAPPEWARVPFYDPGLGTALPAVVQRSAKEAAQLVGHLPLADQQRLRTAALCLWRAQRLASVELPTPLVWRILGLTVVPPD